MSTYIFSSMARLMQQAEHHCSLALDWGSLRSGSHVALLQLTASASLASKIQQCMP